MRHIIPPPLPTSMLRRVVGAAVDFLLPPRCVACDRDGAVICTLCMAEATPAGAPRCPRCWRPWATPGGGLCDRCVADPPAFASLRASFIFDGPVRTAVHALKYQGVSAVAPPLVALVSPAVWPEIVDAVVAVPMPARRQRQRGYNQAAVLAREVARRLGAPIDAAVLRRRHGATQQARQPDLQARRDNMRDAFVGDPARATGRRFLVVDDVTTSGATLDACARALLDAGAARVDAWALARED